MKKDYREESKKVKFEEFTEDMLQKGTCAASDGKFCLLFISNDPQADEVSKIGLKVSEEMKADPVFSFSSHFSLHGFYTVGHYRFASSVLAHRKTESKANLLLL